jgi:hypothetical protein
VAVHADAHLAPETLGVPAVVLLVHHDLRASVR